MGYAVSYSPVNFYSFTSFCHRVLRANMSISVQVCSVKDAYSYLTSAHEEVKWGGKKESWVILFQSLCATFAGERKRTCLPRERLVMDIDRHISRFVLEKALSTVRAYYYELLWAAHGYKGRKWVPGDFYLVDLERPFRFTSQWPIPWYYNT